MNLIRWDVFIGGIVLLVFSRGIVGQPAFDPSVVNHPSLISFFIIFIFTTLLFLMLLILTGIGLLYYFSEEMYRFIFKKDIGEEKYSKIRQLCINEFYSTIQVITFVFVSSWAIGIIDIMMA